MIPKHSHLVGGKHPQDTPCPPPAGRTTLPDMPATSGRRPPQAYSIFMVVGPGGSGKTTLTEALAERDPTLWIPRAWTTRARRPGEPEDAYTFVSRQRFYNRLEEGGFLEYSEFAGNGSLYGTPNLTPPPGCDMLKIFEFGGAKKIKAKFPDTAKMILLLAPSPGVLYQRLWARGDDQESIYRRVELAVEEEEAERLMADVVIVNGDIESTITAAQTAIQIWRHYRGVS